MMVIMVLLMSGCETTNSSVDNENPEEENNLSSAFEKLRNNYDDLREEGVYIFRSGKKEDAIEITGYNMNQRAISKIRDVVGEAIPLEIVEAERTLFVRGTISEIDSDGVLVEGKEFKDTEYDSAYIFIRDFTKIIEDYNGKNKVHDYDKLSKGQEIEVKIVGNIEQVEPPQTSAVVINILSE